MVGRYFSCQQVIDRLLSMNNTHPTTFHRILGLIILVLVLAGFAGLVWWMTGIVGRFTAAELATLLTVVIPVLGAVVTAAATMYAVVRSKSADREREVQQELRKRKGPIYEEFTQFVIGKV